MRAHSWRSLSTGSFVTSCPHFSEGHPVGFLLRRGDLPRDHRIGGNGEYRSPLHNKGPAPVFSTIFPLFYEQICNLVTGHPTTSDVPLGGTLTTVLPALSALQVANEFQRHPKSASRGCDSSSCFLFSRLQPLCIVILIKPR